LRAADYFRCAADAGSGGAWAEPLRAHFDIGRFAKLKAQCFYERRARWLLLGLEHQQSGVGSRATLREDQRYR
jgi:hypothetical protein